MKSSSRYEVSLTLTNDEEIRQLNRIYRSLDRPTDVLSFPLQEGGSLAGAPGALLPLGDIVISLERAQSQAKAYGHSFHRELAFLTVHGMLHLLGLDHQEAAEAAEMERQQQRILAGLGISRQ